MIDRVNIYEAAEAAMMEAIGQLEPQPSIFWLDAMKLDLPISKLVSSKDANLIH